MKGAIAILIFFSLSSRIFGHEVEHPKHPEQEWNFLFTTISNKDGTYKGFSFMKSNFAKTQYLGLSFCNLNKPKIETTAGSFSIEREVDSEVNGYQFKDTIKIDGRQETIKKTNRYIVGLDLRFLPEKLRTKKNGGEVFSAPLSGAGSSFGGKNIEGGFFWGGGIEIDVGVITQKTTLYFQEGNSNLNTIGIPNIPTSVSFDWGPYLIFGAFGNINRLTAFMGIKKVYYLENNQLSFASNIGMKF